MTKLIESQEKTSTKCPVDHQALSQRKTNRGVVVQMPHVTQTADGVWHIYGHAEARAILRGTGTRQAGFAAELVGKMLSRMRAPILFLEGDTHRLLRSKIARFFTPTHTDQNYRAMMERFSDALIAELKQRGRADLSQMAMHQAVLVAAQVVGLTNSRLGGIHKRITALIEARPGGPGLDPMSLYRSLRTQFDLLAFYSLDVRPAIAARRKKPLEDVISHLLAEGYSDPEILSECVTYGAAGMVTTREFIGVAAWHLMEQPRLKERFVAAPEEERMAILSEILRLEPVVGTLLRRATEDIEIESEGQTIQIPAGALLVLHVYSTNADPRVAGITGSELCPQRELPKGVQPQVMSFGDGHHRCPGAFIALQETDTFLRKLLALANLRIEQTPKLSWNDTVRGYQLRDFWIGLDTADSGKSG